MPKPRRKKKRKPLYIVKYPNGQQRMTTNPPDGLPCRKLPNAFATTRR